jgi:hypothetical protein
MLNGASSVRSGAKANQLENPWELLQWDHFSWMKYKRLARLYFSEGE